MFPRAALVIAIGLMLLIAYLVVRSLTGGPVKELRQHMATGAAYMKSLDAHNVPVWIERTKRLLADYQPGTGPIGVYGLGGKPIPADLQQLGIIRIDMSEDQVHYVWMGGLDHTELEVHRLPDGTFQFVARYDDAHTEVIWPKRPNQAMQLTAPRSVCPPSVATTFNLQPRALSGAVADLVSR